MYDDKIKEYWSRIKNKKTLQFVNFLQTVFEWVEILIEKKVLTRDQLKELTPFMPTEIMHQLDKIPSQDITQEQFIALKRLTLENTSALINKIIDIGMLRMHDFDILQFNLYQIFGKEELASMMEWSRLHLGKVIKDREIIRQENKKKNIENEKQRILAFSSLLPKEQYAYIMKWMFDFTPSARTHVQRVHMINDHKKTILNQRIIFHAFEEKLSEATQSAKGQAQMNVYRQMGTVTRQMETVTQGFRAKAQEFASEKGPKKAIGEAKNRVLKGKDRLDKDVKGKGDEWKNHLETQVDSAQKKIHYQSKKVNRLLHGKDELWKAHFSDETRQARERISNQGDVLKNNMVAKGKKWQRFFSTETQKAQERLRFKGDTLKNEAMEKSHSFAKKGSFEVDRAEVRINKGKEVFHLGVSGFSDDIKNARVQFGDTSTAILKVRDEYAQKRTHAQESFISRGKEVGYEIYSSILTGRDGFIKLRGVAQESFYSRGQDIETRIYGNIYVGRRDFEKKRNIAREKFLSRAKEMKKSGTKHVTTRKGSFADKKLKAQIQFGARADEINKTPSAQNTRHTGFSGPDVAKAQSTFLSEGRKKQLKMKEKMEEQRAKFSYDTRFARYNIKQRGIAFADKIAQKREEFAEHGQKMVARHKAHQKAHLIQNVLRTIRSMQ